MSVHYIVDGYNAIHKIPSLKDKPLKMARDGLIGFVRVNHLWGSYRNRMTVVFDGKSGVVSPNPDACLGPNINIVFSRDETADKRIKRLVDESSNPKQLVVVTDDRDIMYYAKSGGAKTLSIKEWVCKKKAPEQRLLANGRNNAPAELDNITEELKRIWLKKER